MDRPHLIIIGNGMAATRLLEELSARQAPFRCTVIGEEAAPGYNRILLSPWLAGEKADDQLVTHPPAWYAERGIILHRGDPVVALDLPARQLRTASGLSMHWDELVLATGSRALRLPLPGADLPGVLAFRSWQDTIAMRAQARPGAPAVVIGGGLLGLEAAYGLNRLGMQVTVVHNMAWLMNRQLDAEAGGFLADALRARGIRLQLAASSTHFDADENGRLCALALADGTRIPAEMAVMALGIVPEVSLARAAGLSCQRAIEVDPWLRSSVPGVSALGECCQIHGELFGMVAPIQQQARVLADRLCRRDSAGYQPEVLPTRLKVSGIDLFSAGNLDALADCRSVAWRDPRAGHYRRLWLREGRLAAAVLFGDVGDGTRYFDLIQQGARISNPTALLMGAEAAA